MLHKKFDGVGGRPLLNFIRDVLPARISFHIHDTMLVVIVRFTACDFTVLGEQIVTYAKDALQFVRSRPCTKIGVSTGLMRV